MGLRNLKFALPIAAVAALLAMPGSAAAAEQCLFQNEGVTAQNQDRVEGSLLCLNNVYRVRSGVAAMPRDSRLAAAARGHSVDMLNRNFFQHINPDGAGPGERAVAAGYPGDAGENIAYNPAGTALSLFEQWRASPDHNTNMLNPNYRAAGFGVVPGCCGGAGSGITGTQNFGLVAANSSYTALDLFASSDACARAKLKLIRGRERLKKKKGAARRRLKAKIREARRLSRKICKAP